ncbi:hypothetical protein F4810DRAFT_684079 [Camillea tinctor]|nr:hypothetical protein F4810DRAFT_684079 [Camillea tinctor]
MLDAGDPGKDQDKFKTGVIDTLVSMVQGVPGEDRCIILVGYEDKMKTMFRNVNIGLSRRFPIERPFRFENFNVAQLAQILHKKMAEGDLEFTPNAIEAAKAMFERALMRPNFTNAGEVDSCLATAKLNYEARISRLPLHLQDSDTVFDAVDFDPDWDRGSRAGANDCRVALEGRVHADIVNTLVAIHNRCSGAKIRGINPRKLIGTNFVFKGQPGTGKTTTAQHMGKLFYGMGFLSSDEVVECSAGDLIGQYVGQTGPKTRQKLQEAMGRVLFVDEAYRFLISQFALDALEELMNFLTKPANQGKTIVILAGYTDEMNFLMSKMPVLAGLFRDEIVFNNIPPQDCISLLARELAEVNPAFGGQAFFTDPKSEHYGKIQRGFRVLQAIPGWSNARDIRHLAKRILGRDLESVSDNNSPSTPTFTLADHVIHCMKQMIEQQRTSYSGLGTGDYTQRPILEPPLGASDTGPAMENPQLAPPPAAVDTEINIPQISSRHHIDSQHERGVAGGVLSFQPPGAAAMDSDQDEHYSVTREVGVSDAMRNRLQEAYNSERVRRSKRDARRKQIQGELNDKESAASHGNPSNGGGADLNAVCDGLRKELMDIDKEMQDEEKVQQALEKANRCENGYQYVRDGNGFRCTGGAHFIPDAEVRANLR